MSKFNYKLSELFQDVDLNLIQCLIIEEIVASKFGGGQEEIDNAIFLCDGCIRMGLPTDSHSWDEDFKMDMFLAQFDDPVLCRRVILAFNGEYELLIEDLK